MKKTLLALLGALLAQPVIAQDLEDEARNFTYEYEGQTLTYTVLDEDAKTCETKGGSIFSGGNYVSGNLKIPATAKDGDMEYSVTSIGMFAFSECSGLTTVTIPESVTSIGDYAFYWCSDLTSVEIPNSVSSIGNNAFYQCSNLTSVSIGNSVSSIGVAAFYQCSNLTSVTIPGSVSSIANTAFENCSGLTSFKVEDGESSISFGENALTSCPIEDLYLGRNWTYAGSGALSPGIKTLTIGDKVTALPDNAFSGCTGLTSVVFNAEKCNSVGSQVFPASIDSFTFGENVQIIPAYCCQGLTNLISVTIPNSVTSIGVSAFSGCSGFTSVTIPNSVTSIGNYAFDNCSGLKSFTVEDGKGKVVFRGHPFRNVSLENLYLGKNWECDIEEAIPTSIKSVEIGNSVTTLPGYAFNGCSGLTSVSIGNSVTSISVGAFYDCSSLTSVTIPNSVTSISKAAFYGCSSLTSVTIPNSVTSIGNLAFYNCWGLKSFKVADGERTIYFGANALKTSPIEDLYLGRNWTYAGSGAISTGIQTLTLGDKVTALPDYAFLDCAGLTSVEIPNSVTSIGDCAFSVCVGLTSVTIPNSVTLIGEKAFYGCENLKSITISNSVTSISKEAFSGCSGLTEVIVPPSVETIGTSAFAENTKLCSIIMGHKVNTIGDKAFDNCPAQTVYITAQTPATVSDNTFGNYTGTLKVQGEAAKESYLSADYWKQFENSDLLNEPERFEIEGGTNINGKPGETIQLTATLYPGDVTLPQVFWHSTNPAVATVDHNGLVTIHADLSEIMAMAEGNEEETATQSCKIIAESLYANGPTAEFTIKEDITTGVEEISADVIDSSLPVQVYTLQGMMVGDCVENLSAGIYIVRQGKNVKKIAVK